MEFNELSEKDVSYIEEKYRDYESRKDAQTHLASYFGIHERTVRKWAKKLGIGVMKENIIDPAKILIYDLETPRLKGYVWWSGKQYVNGNDIIDEPNVITVAWKWLGDNKIHHLTWDKEQSDRELIEKFLVEYNRADLVVGINNDNFDNRWINARAIKHGFKVNNFVKSLDLQKEAKRLFRLPSYSLKYLCRYFDVTMKQSHEGITMWDKIQEGTDKEKKEYLKKMVDYNIGDIVSTEEVYMKLLPYVAPKIHAGVLKGGDKVSCPHCGKDDISLERTLTTPAGTIQRVMICEDDGVQFKISNSNYLKNFG